VATDEKGRNDVRIGGLMLGPVQRVGRGGTGVVRGTVPNGDVAFQLRLYQIPLPINTYLNT
jgi:hypothetical protein